MELEFRHVNEYKLSRVPTKTCCNPYNICMVRLQVTRGRFLLGHVYITMGHRNPRVDNWRLPY